MRDIVLTPDQPVSLTIAADPRISSTDYVDDQIWELAFNSGEPQAITLQTNYGLRAANMRMFPRFTIGSETSTNPAKFAKPPILQKIFPNFISITFSPFIDLTAISEYWVPNSHAISGRIRLTNTGPSNQKFNFQLVTLLQPSENGSRAVPDEIEGVAVISGRTGDLFPVVFITGGSSTVSSPYPALIHELELPPGNSRQFIWCHAARHSLEDSFNLARDTATSDWEAEIAKIDMQNSSQMEIYTGDQEWDRNLFFSQKNAHGLLLEGTPHLKGTSYVTTRTPDDGFSQLGDGSDYSPKWSGQTSIDTYYLSNLLLPSAPAVMTEILKNHLDAINENGELDWRPGLGGQRTNRLTTPLLANIAWKIYQVNEDVNFLSEVFPSLVDYLTSWFSSQHDRDQDGIPEWDHPLQAGFEDHPIFSRWNSTSQGVDITTSESPALCAFLYSECQTMIRIAKVLNSNDRLDEFQAKAEKLRDAVEDAWNEAISGYTYWDRDSHKSPGKVSLGQMEGSGSIRLNQSFPEPQRIVFQIYPHQETTRKTQLIIHGQNASGKHRIELIPTENLLWFPSLGTATSDQVYQAIESIEIKGLDQKDRVVISTTGLEHQDITTLLPIWSRIPSTDRVNSMVEKCIMVPNLFWREYGLPACPETGKESDGNSCNNVYLPWCLFIAEGLLSYGYRKLTAELVTRIMNAIGKSVKFVGCFRQTYDADSGQGSGEIDALWGLAPLGLFLESLGVRIISPWKIHLAGNNPYPWPVTVKYRGMTVLRGLDKTQVVFPDGQTILISDPEPCMVSME